MSKEHIIIKTPPKKEQIENKKRLDFKNSFPMMFRQTQVEVQTCISQSSVMQPYKSI